MRHPAEPKENASTDVSRIVSHIALPSFGHRRQCRKEVYACNVKKCEYVRKVKEIKYV